MNHEELNRASETTLQRLRAMHPSTEFEMDAVSGRIGANVDGMHITDPFLSECGRFTATPDYYGLSMKAALLMTEHNLLCPEDEFESDPPMVECPFDDYGDHLAQELR